MDLGKHVLDKSMLDKNGQNAGKVDDILLEIPDPAQTGEDSAGEPTVLAIITGTMALAQNWPPPFRWLARTFYRLLGLKDPHPCEIPWKAISKINVAVYLAVSRNETGLDELERVVTRRYIGRIPGA